MNKEYIDFPKRENRCKDCRNIYYKIYKQRKSTELVEYRKGYRESNKELLKTKRSLYYKENSDILKGKSKINRVNENKSTIKEYKRRKNLEKSNLL
jgi:hypothetical protein